MNRKEWRKEAADIIQSAIMDGQNQIHDLHAKRATAQDIEKRMQNTFSYCWDRLEKLVAEIELTNPS